MYVSRDEMTAPLEDLMEAADRVGEGRPLPPALGLALLHGSSVGGARPKVLLKGGERDLIAKFSSSTDTYAIVKGEFAAMELARRAGLDVASVDLVDVMGREVLLITRFDRVPGRRNGAHWFRPSPCSSSTSGWPLRELRRPGADRPRAFHHRSRVVARAVRPHHVQHPDRQQR